MFYFSKLVPNTGSGLAYMGSGNLVQRIRNIVDEFRNGYIGLGMLHTGSEIKRTQKNRRNKYQEGAFV